MNPITHQPDPYNYPSMQKRDSMSLSVIKPDRDGMRTHTKKFYTGRTWNDSLSTQDIAGKKLDPRSPAPTVRLSLVLEQT